MHGRKAADNEGVRPASDLQSDVTPSGRAWAMALIALAFVGRAVFVALPVNSDTAMFVYAGKLVAGGGRPGVDLLDNKLPSVGLLMSVPYRLFGAHWSAYGSLGLALSMVAVWFLWRAARERWGESSATLVAVAAAVWLNFPPAVYGQLQLETIQIALASIAGPAVLLALHPFDPPDAATAGLCGGMAMWAKPTGGAVLAAAAIVLVIFTGNRTRFRAVGALLAGTLIPLILCLVCVFVSGMGSGLTETLRQLRDYANQSTFNAMDVAKPLLVVAFLGFPLLVLGGVFRRDRVAAVALPGDVAFVLLWFAAELAGVVAQRRMYAYHFLVLGPPAALCVGLVARRVRGRSLAMAFGPIVAVSLFLAAGLWIDRPVDSRDDHVIAYLRTHAGGGEAIWVDDYPRLLIESDRRAGSTVPLIFLMANGDGAPDFFGRTLLNDWALRRPQYVAFFAEPKRVADLYRFHMADVAESPKRADAIERQLDAMQAFLAANYHAETDIGNVRIWRRGPIASDSIADVHEGGR